MAYSYVGKSVSRLDSLDKVLGRAKYVADMVLPDILWGRIFRSDRPHARIISIDTSRAERLPGVKAVMTAADAPAVYGGIMVFDQPFCARDKVRYVGEPVAAVAAVDMETAEEALELIQVVYEDLPAVYDPLEAMKPEAPVLHEGLADYECSAPVRRYGNVPNHFEF